MKDNSERKKINWSTLLQTIVGSVIGLISGLYLIEKLNSGEMKPQELILILFFIFLALFININVHEFGHLVFGKIFGYSLITYRIGFLSWSNENGRMKFSIIKNKGYSGLCAMLPPKNEPTKYESLLYYAGGILLNIFSGILLLVLPIILSELSDPTKWFFLTTGGIAVALGTINLLPFTSNNYPTDGKIIWSIVLDRPFAKKLIQINMMTSELAAGVRPRDIDLPSFENDDSLQGYDMLVLMYKYYRALDSSNAEEMLSYISIIESNIEKFPQHALPSVYYELCYVSSITKNTRRAKEYYKKAGQILQKDKDINGLRVKAYYEFFINDNYDIALGLCEEALMVAEKYPIKGQGLMEEALIMALKAQILELDN